MTAWWRVALVLLALGGLLAASPAHAASVNAIPGASYNGTHAGGGGGLRIIR